MNSLSLRGSVKYENGRFEIIPATNADKQTLLLFAKANQKKILSITFKSSVATKTYNQLKTAHALMEYLFIAIKGYKPTKKQKDKFYQQLLEEFSDKVEVEDVLHKKTILEPVSFSNMSIGQLSRFIQSLVQLLHENTQGYLLSADDLVDIKDIFAEWKNYLSNLNEDPTDYDEYGNLLSLEDYRLTHTISYASGRVCDSNGGGLEMAHIVSRGSDPAFEDKCWNVMMLTHEEHQEIMHGLGWNELIRRFPHIRGRVERAINKARKIYEIIKEESL